MSILKTIKRDNAEISIQLTEKLTCDTLATQGTPRESRALEAPEGDDDGDDDPGR
jgi:hypothetical protein